jgi:hypothetical protein
MNPSRAREGSLRLDSLDTSRLAWALGISLAIHLLCYGSYELGRRLDWWHALHMPPWLQKVLMLAPPVPKEQKPPPQEVPLVFLDVDPSQATADAPKDAKYYSSRNSQAANPESDKDTGIPKIDGKQTQIAKVENTPRSPYDKLLPDFNSLNQKPQPERAQPKQAMPPGDLAMAKPDLNLRQDDGKAEEAKPRTIREALMRQNRNKLVGEQMKQEGGVSRHLEMSSLDAKATPFGQYDAEFINAVQSRWFDLLDNMSYSGYRRGKVVVQFHLSYDGRISDMKVLDSDVGEVLGLLCQKAVLDPAPYDKWPREMRLMVDKDYREIQFTFFYN